ncbi:M24 family metallopeptidase [Devosia sp.]|uniref:M24 family metallopeptidase n=1 Tax=Devosia sp. TaxID=1871048 RepID=UPI002F1E4AA7
MQPRAPVSTAELERRWSAVRLAMREQGLDAVVMQNSSDWVGGYVRWFTDLPATNGYPRTVVFYRDRPMTVIEMGEFGAVRELEDDPVHRGVGRIACTPSFASIAYTNGYDAELLVAELRRTGARTVGLLAPGALPSALTAALAAALGLETIDASDLVDEVKAVKSPEEIALLHSVAALQDQVFAAVCGYIRPGLRDIDIADFAQDEAHRLGSDQGIYLGTSAPVGRSSRFAGRMLQGRTIEKGDHFSLLIEVNGPGGMYVEIARTMVLGKAPEPLKEAFATVKAAQDHTLSQLRPGVAAAAVAEAHDRWMQARGLPPERRLFAHGQGVDMVERPLIRRDETMRLRQGMCLAVHPGYDDGSVFAVICDNYMIEADGPGACLHRTEKRLFEL